MKLLLAGMLAAVSASAAVPPERFDEIDRDLRDRASDSTARRALRAAETVWSQDPSSSEAAWRLGMAAYFVGLRLTEEPDRKTALFRRGYEAALAGWRNSADCSACAFWAAINLALHGEQAGNWRFLNSLSEIRARLRAVREKKPGYAGGGADRLLGLIEMRLPGILGGSDRRAREHFEAAMRLAPEEPLNYLYLSDLLRREERFGDAIEIERRALRLEPRRDEMPESKEAREELARRLRADATRDAAHE